MTVFHNPKPQEGGQKLPPQQTAVLNLIRQDPYATRKAISEKLGIYESAVQKHLDTLKKKAQ